MEKGKREVGNQNWIKKMLGNIDIKFVKGVMENKGGGYSPFL